MTSFSNFFVCKGSLSFGYFFKRNLQNRPRLKGPPFDFFRHCATFFKNFSLSPKGSLQDFCYFATECMFINQKGSPFYIFRQYATFFERKNSKVSSFFSKKNVLRFLSLRFKADFRRSRLVTIKGSIVKYDAFVSKLLFSFF